MNSQSLSTLLRTKIVYIAVILLAAYLAWTYFGNTVENKPAQPPVRVQITPVMRQDMPMLVQLVGTVVAYESVAIKSRLDSQIIDVHFKDGDFVQEGQIMFDLDDRAIKAQIAQFEAAMEKEKAQLTNTHLQYQRALKLIKSNVVSQAQVDDARAAYEAQMAQVGAAEANLKNARVQLTYTKINAPISGRTGTINVTRGNNVKANDAQALVTINHISPIRVQTSIPQRYYEQLRNTLNGGEVKVFARSKDGATEAIGKLEYLDNSIDASTGTFTARAVFPNTDEKLWPGMFVNVTMDLGMEKDVLVIPVASIQGDEDNHFIFITDENKKKAVKKPITVSRTTADLAIISKGINEGDNVIIDGLLRITNGAPIEIAQPKASPAKIP